jgi:MFS family permease
MQSLSSLLNRLAPAGSLWRDHDFMRVFWANTLSVLGTAVTQMALPLTAVQLLHASAADMGALAACQLLPFVLGLPAGVWIDRSHKRRLAIAFDLFAAAGLALVPIAFLGGFLSLPLLWLVGAMVSTNEAIGGSALQVFITNLVGRERLVLANSKLSAAASASMVVGPAFAAGLVAMVGAPLAISVDAASFLVSAWLIWRIRFDEATSVAATRRHVLTETWQGLQLIWHTPVLRGLVWVVAVWIPLNDSFKALYVLHAARNLLLDANDIALMNALGAIGGLFGATLAHHMERRFGIRSALAGGVALGGLGYMLYALPSLHMSHANWAAGLALMVMDCGAAMYVVSYLSLRQAVTPDALLGRMVTSMRFLTIVLAPAVTILIGHAGDAFGLVPIFITIGAICVVVGALAGRLLPVASVGGVQPRT